MRNNPAQHNSSLWLTGARKTRPHTVAFVGLTAAAGLLIGAGVGIATLPKPTDVDLQVQTAGAQQPTQSTGQLAQTTPAVEETTPPPPEPVMFQIAAVGDFLPHTNVHFSAKTANGYDFGPLLKQIDPLVESAAVSLCHMEVPLLEEGQKITGYPMFGAHRQIAFDLKDRGWDGCTTASNHSVDKGFAGIESTIAALEEAGLAYSGTARTEAEANQLTTYTVTVNEYDTVIASISATRNLNGLPLPQGKPWSVNLIDSEQIIKQARAARDAGAHIVVVSIHDGVEYTPVPAATQQEIAKELAQSQVVDLFVGHHPHVPQPITKLDGGPNQKGMWTAYSLGNFISNQDRNCCVAQTSNGLMMFAQIETDQIEPPQITTVKWRALTVDRAGKHTVLDLSKLHSANKGHGTLSAKEIEQRYKQVRDVVGDEAEELTELAVFSGTVKHARNLIASPAEPDERIDHSTDE